MCAPHKPEPTGSCSGESSQQSIPPGGQAEGTGVCGHRVKRRPPQGLPTEDESGPATFLLQSFSTQQEFCIHRQQESERLVTKEKYTFTSTSYRSLTFPFCLPQSVDSLKYDSHEDTWCRSTFSLPIPTPAPSPKSPLTLVLPR